MKNPTRDMRFVKLDLAIMTAGSASDGKRKTITDVGDELAGFAEMGFTGVTLTQPYRPIMGRMAIFKSGQKPIEIDSGNPAALTGATLNPDYTGGVNLNIEDSIATMRAFHSKARKAGLTVFQDIYPGQIGYKVVSDAAKAKQSPQDHNMQAYYEDPIMGPMARAHDEKKLDITQLFRSQFESKGNDVCTINVQDDNDIALINEYYVEPLAHHIRNCAIAPNNMDIACHIRIMEPEKLLMPQRGHDCGHAASAIFAKISEICASDKGEPGQVILNTTSAPLWQSFPAAMQANLIYLPNEPIAAETILLSDNRHQPAMTVLRGNGDEIVTQPQDPENGKVIPLYPQGDGVQFGAARRFLMPQPPF